MQDDKTSSPSWANGLTPDDFPGDLKLVATECGVDVAILMADKLGGLNLYVRNADSLFKDRKEEYIIKNSNGANVKQLAIDTNWSERQIRKVLERDTDKKRQITLFD